MKLVGALSPTSCSTSICAVGDVLLLRRAAVVPGGRQKGLNEAGGRVPCHFKSLSLQKAFEAMLPSSIADSTVPSNEIKLQKKTAHKNLLHAL